MKWTGLLARLVKPGPSCAEKLAEMDAANRDLQMYIALLETFVEASEQEIAALRAEVVRLEAVIDYLKTGEIDRALIERSEVELNDL